MMVKCRQQTSLAVHPVSKKFSPFMNNNEQKGLIGFAISTVKDKLGDQNLT